MSDTLRAAIGALQAGDDPQAQMAFGAIAEGARLEPGECAAELSRALLAEQAAGALRTPRLLTLLGVTREPVPACVPVCLEFLRNLASEPLPPTALLGAAAVVARSHPRALLPDLAAMQAGSPAAMAVDSVVTRTLPLLLSVTSDLLRECPDGAVTDMARWLWFDCALLDLMTLADFAGLQVERAGVDDPIIALMVDLVERVPATADEKRYAGQRLLEAGLGEAVVEQLKGAWRAIRVAPAATVGLPPPVDPEPPPPDARVDECLAAFSEGDEQGVELARGAIDTLFEDKHLPVALPWWVAVTVDALPARRRRMDVRWALVRIAAAQRRPGARSVQVPPSLLRRWLDTPQLLDASGTQIALGLLALRQPGLVAQHYLHRLVAVSDTGLRSARHAELVAGEAWRALVEAEPAAVLRVASRWIAFGHGQGAFLELLLALLIERAHAQPALVASLAGTLASVPDMGEDAVDVAREFLARVGTPPTGGRQP